MRTPEKGEWYAHENGGVYRVLTIANNHTCRTDYPLTIVYQGEDGKTWAKEVNCFMRKMTWIPSRF